jgi:hypothetical protein
MHPSHADRVSPTSPIAILAMVIDGGVESVVRTVIAEAGVKADVTRLAGIRPGAREPDSARTRHPSWTTSRRLVRNSPRACVSSRAGVSSRPVTTAAYQRSSGRLGPRRVPAAARIRPTQQRAGIGAGACHCCSSRGAAAWTCAFAARPRAGAQELAAGALARVKAGVVCCPGCRPLIGHSSGGCCGTRGAASTGKGSRMQAECPQGVPFRTQHPLGVVVNRPSVWPDR